MDNDINFIDLDGLKKFLEYPVINFIEQHLYQKFGGRRSDYPWGAIVNPHATLGAEDHNLCFNLEILLFKIMT